MIFLYYQTILFYNEEYAYAQDIIKMVKETTEQKKKILDERSQSMPLSVSDFNTLLNIELTPVEPYQHRVR